MYTHINHFNKSNIRAVTITWIPAIQTSMIQSENSLVQILLDPDSQGDTVENQLNVKNYILNNTNFKFYRFTLPGLLLFTIRIDLHC